MGCSVLKWDQKLSVGVESMDLQHRYFIDLLNRLVLELEGSDTEYQVRLIDELSGYAKQHFISEENIMYKLSYPDLKEHTESHQLLLERLNGQIGLYLLGMLDAGEIAHYLSKWLAQHVVKEDRKFGDFIAEVKTS